MAATAAIAGAGGFADNVTSIAQASAANITADDLVVVQAAKFDDAATEDFVLGDCTKTAGTSAVADGFLLDHSHGDDANDQYSGGWSAKVTGSGSFTATVAGASTFSFLIIAVISVTGVDTTATRVRDTDGAHAASGAIAVPALTAEAGDFGVGIEVGGFTAGTVTPTGSWQTMYEQENGDHLMGSAIYLEIAAGPTSTPAWDHTGSDSPWCASGCTYKVAEAGGGFVPYPFPRGAFAGMGGITGGMT